LGRRRKANQKKPCVLIAKTWDGAPPKFFLSKGLSGAALSRYSTKRGHSLHFITSSFNDLKDEKSLASFQ